MKSVFLFILPMFFPDPAVRNTDHAVYISVTTLEVDVDGKVKGSLKIFSDDLEDALHRFSGERPAIVGRQDLSPIASQFEQYLRKHLTIRARGGGSLLTLENLENVGDSTWAYFKTGLESPSDWLNIESSILIDIFPDQVNIVEVKLTDKPRYLKLIKSQPSAKVIF